MSSHNIIARKTNWFRKIVTLMRLYYRTEPILLDKDSKKSFRNLTLAILLATVYFPTSANSEAKNLAYNEEYIWQLAHRLATVYGLRHNFSNLEAADSSQFLFDIALDYHHRMIACDGPLPQIAPRLKFSLDTFTITSPPTVEQVLRIIGSTDHDVWPIMVKWANGIDKDISTTFHNGTISTNFPSCLVPGYEIPKLQDN